MRPYFIVESLVTVEFLYVFSFTLVFVVKEWSKILRVTAIKVVLSITEEIQEFLEMIFDILDLVS
jgi:hypothetical protein